MITELRIGNLVYYKNNILEVEYLYCKEPFDAEFYTAIPLTEEWLFKFGFVQKKYNAGNSIGFEIPTNKGNLILLIWKVAPLPDNWIMQVFIGTINISEIKYVHQLQNLYYALTGKELEIKL